MQGGGLDQEANRPATGSMALGCRSRGRAYRKLWPAEPFWWHYPGTRGI